jgi:hypothetical protein
VSLPLLRGPADPTTLEMWRHGAPVDGLYNLETDAAHVASPGTTVSSISHWRGGQPTPLVRGRSNPTAFTHWRRDEPPDLLVSQIGDIPPTVNSADLFRMGELPGFLQVTLDAGTLDHWRRRELLVGVVGAGTFPEQAAFSRSVAGAQPSASGTLTHGGAETAWLPGYVALGESPVGRVLVGSGN